MLTDSDSNLINPLPGACPGSFCVRTPQTHQKSKKQPEAGRASGCTFCILPAIAKDLCAADYLFFLYLRIRNPRTRAPRPVSASPAASPVAAAVAGF